MVIEAQHCLAQQSNSNEQVVHNAINWALQHRLWPTIEQLKWFFIRNLELLEHSLYQIISSVLNKWEIVLVPFSRVSAPDNDWKMHIPMHRKEKKNIKICTTKKFLNKKN